MKTVQESMANVAAVYVDREPVLLNDRLADGMTMLELSAKYRHNGIEIGGWMYDVLTDADDTIVATRCHTRWPMTGLKTGDQWLDTMLQLAVYERKGR